MTVIDLKPPLDFDYFNLKNVKEIADEHRTDSLFTDHGFSSPPGLPKMRQSIPRKSQGPNILMPGSVPVYGLRSTDVSRKLARYRSLFACDANQTLSHGNSKPDFKINAGRCQREQRLANIRRLCPSVDSCGPRALYRRSVRRRVGPNRLCTRFNNDRPLSLALSVGKISQAQSGHKASHTF